MKLVLLLLLALGLTFAGGRRHGHACDNTTQTEQRMALSVLQIEIVGLSLCKTDSPKDRK